MRIIVAYDGSDYADAALADLARAGLPGDAEAEIITVADVWPHLPDSCFRDHAPEEVKRMSPTLRRAYELASSAMRDARESADQAARRLRGQFPDWKVEPQALAGSAAKVLVDRARQWKADLIVVGSQGLSALGRALLGSVSQSVVTHAGCSVRVARRPRASGDAPPRIVLGLDGSPGAAAALNAVSLRAWPPGTDVRVVVGVDARLATALPGMMPELSWPMPIDLNSSEWPKQAAESAVAELKRAGLGASADVRNGDPKKLLIEAAENFGADSVFIGARGLSRIEGILLGSVSAAVAARAPCSVEVVRFE